MDIHQNARLTFRSREALVLFVLREGLTRRAAAAAFRVSARTVAKWLGRFEREGRGGLRDRSSRPGISPRRVSDALASRVVELRRQRLPGYAVARQTGLSVATALPATILASLLSSTIRTVTGMRVSSEGEISGES